MEKASPDAKIRLMFSADKPKFKKYWGQKEKENESKKGGLDQIQRERGNKKKKTEDGSNPKILENK